MKDNTTKFTIPHDKVWLRPDIAYFKSKSQEQDIDPKEIKWNGRYKTIRELRDIAIFGLCLNKIYGTLFFVQINSKDSSPDAFVMRVSPDNQNINEISPVEITFYGRNRIGLPEQSLTNTLAGRRGKFWKLPSHYCLLIHIGRRLRVDNEEIVSHLKKINANFQVFSIQEISNYPDTIARIISYRPEYMSRNINVGEICDILKKSNIPETVTQIRGRIP